MAHGRPIIALIAVVGLTGWGEPRPAEWPHSGPMPDDPVKVKPLRYDSVTKGNQSYRPIDPMPWGDVNKRVMPQGALPPPASAGPQVATPVRPTAPGLAPKATAPTSGAAPAMPDHSKHGAPKP